MKVILFGGSGMVGQGVLRECALAPDVERILAIGRTPLEVKPADAPLGDKLRELNPIDLYDLSSYTKELEGYDACFFCLGVSSAGMNENDYARITHDLTLAAAKELLKSSPAITFIYVSGEGTDSSEKGRAMWARVKGRTENDLLKLPLRSAFMFRPGLIVPLHGIKSKTRSYRIFYTASRLCAPAVTPAVSQSQRHHRAGRAGDVECGSRGTGEESGGGRARSMRWRPRDD